MVFSSDSNKKGERAKANRQARIPGYVQASHRMSLLAVSDS